MDSLQVEWPEPVIPVQALSESGMAAIPDRYIKPPAERPSWKEARGGGVGSIPVIDLGGLGEGAVECRATMKAISDACRDWGFFQVVNHGVSPDLMQSAMEVWRDFFRLPLEEKQAYANNPKTYEGYGSRLGVEKGAVLDWGDYFFLYLRPDSLKNYRKWPTKPNSCREITEELSDALVKLCRILLKVLSISLGLDVDYLDKAFGGDGAGATLRVNYYPKCPQPDLTLGLSPHSDPGGVTVLLADERVKGLQVRKGNEWVTVDPIPGALVLNLGDQIQVLSNATYKSVEHRVLVNAEEERLSIVLFYNPKSDLPLEPARELVTPDRPPLYKPMTYDEYRLFVRTKGLHGKAQVESLKAV